MVVISLRRRGGRLVTVVPIISWAPEPVESWHYELPAGAYPPARGVVWVKADMVTTVSLARLDRVKVRGAGGARMYQSIQLATADIALIRPAVKAELCSN